MRRAVLALVFALAGALPAHAQIPVTDVANLTAQMQHILAWAQQYAQMVRQLDNQIRQIDQMQRQIEMMSGRRGLGSVLNGPMDQAARRYLPTDLRQIYDLYNGTVVPGYNAIAQRIKAMRGTLSSLPPGYFPAGSAMEGQLNEALAMIGTQRVMAEESYRTMSDRTTNVENLIATIDVANDPQAIAELQARIQAEQVLATNEANRIALLQYQQQIQRQQSERRQLERFVQGNRAAAIGTVAFPKGVSP
jgi:type IV secretion system protein VirB5